MNTITSSSTGEGWVPGLILTSNYTTAPNTRQLSISSISGANSTQKGPTNGTVNQSLLLYEDSSGSVATLLQVQQLCPFYYQDCNLTSFSLDVTRTNPSIPRSDFSPINYNSTYDPYAHLFVPHGVIISSTLYESRPGAKFGPPFAAGASVFDKESGLSVDLLICDNGDQTSGFSLGSPFSCDNVAYTTYRSWTNASHGFFEARTQKLSHNLEHRNLANRLH